ncbi:MAG: CHAT domain-containing tetratricopeptide repeat protein [Cyclobacteriaceae bacterium]
MPYLPTLLFLCGMHTCLATPCLVADTGASDIDYLTLAKSFEAQQDISKAIDYYELAKTQLAQKQNDINLVYVLNKLASLYTSEAATQKKAEAYLDSASAILENRLLENDTLQALTWYTGAKLAKAQRNFNQAIAYFQNSLERKRAFYGENHLAVTDDLEQIGRVYLYSLQNPYASEPYFEQALRIWELADNHNRSYVTCYYHLAFANRLQYDYEKALAYGFKALEGYENLPEPDFADLVIANSALGHTYYSMDSIARALDYGRKALSLTIQGDLLPYMDMALHYNNQAELHLQAGAFDSTIYYAQLALSYQPVSVNLANSYQYLGNAYREKGQPGQAFRYYQQSKTLKESILGDHHTQLVTLYIDLGKAFETNQQADSALHYYQKALTSARISQQDTAQGVDVAIQAGDDLAAMEEVLEKITHLLSTQYSKTQNPQYLTQALPYYMLFDRFMDLSRTDFSSEGSKLLLSGYYKDIYEQAIGSSYQLYQTTHADSLLRWVFHFMEKSKAMVLLESIHQTEANHRILPDSLVQQNQFLQAQLAYCQSELINAEKQGDEPAVVSDWQLQKANVLREIEMLHHHIQTSYPNYYNIAYRDLTVGLDSLQKHLVPHQPVISYFWGDSAVYALLITSDDVKIHQIKEVAVLKKAISQYQDVLTNDVVFDPSYANFLQFQESAHSLYQLLLAPLLVGITPEYLTVVLDGDLTNIPFDGFITSMIETEPNDIRYEKLPFLIKTFEVSYEFSLSVAFWEKQYDQFASDEDELNVVGFGIKNFDNLSKNRQYASLGGAEKEVRYIKEKFPQAQIFLNAEATETHFKQQAPEADILHIATHGMADLENPFASQFVFYPEGKEDGAFHLYELYNTPLKAKVLLLSACESGVGKHYAGEGNFSLARSFIYAGCKSVVMSLWQVNDIITEQMIKGIYNQLANQQTVSKSLRSTKLAMIEEGMYAHPQCWAGMVPLGNVSLEVPKPAHRNYISIIFITLGLGTLLLLRLVFVMRRDKKKVLDWKLS